MQWPFSYSGGFLISIVAAMTRKRVIARGGRLPWRIPEETALYRSITKNGTVIVGRRTFQGLSNAEMGRHCFVLSRTLKEAKEQNLKSNLKYIDIYADYVKKTNNKTWSMGQKKFLDILYAKKRRLKKRNFSKVNVKSVMHQQRNGSEPKISI